MIQLSLNKESNFWGATFLRNIQYKSNNGVLKKARDENTKIFCKIRLYLNICGCQRRPSKSSV